MPWELLGIIFRYMNVKRLLNNSKLQICTVVVLIVLYSIRVYMKTIRAMTVPNDYLYVISLVVMIVGGGLTIVTAFLCLNRKWKIFQIYPVIGVILGLLFIFVMPIYTTPDEPFHFDASYNLSNRLMGIDATGNTGMAYRRKCDTEYHTTMFREKVYEQMGKLYHQTTDETLVEAEDISNGDSNFVAYIIPALGITIGRLLRLNFIGTAVLGTVFNVTWFVLWMTYALKKIPFGERVLFTVLLLPIVLQEVSSFSRDNPLIMGAFLVISLTLRWKYSGERIKISEAIVFSYASCILIMVKTSLYAYLILFAVVILFDKKWLQGTTGKFTIGIITGCAIILVVFLLPLHGWERIYGVLQAEHYIEYAKTNSASLAFYISHPSETIRIFANTIRENGKMHLLQLTGHGLGWIEIYNSTKDHIIYIVLAVVAAVRYKEENTKISARTRIGCVAFGIIGIVLCMFAMLVFWNPAGAKFVDGLQGRYYIPAMPLFFLGIGYWRRPTISVDMNLYYPILMSGMGYVIAVNILRYNVLVV